MHIYHGYECDELYQTEVVKDFDSRKYDVCWKYEPCIQYDVYMVSAGDSRGFRSGYKMITHEKFDEIFNKL
jgi:hypothetical protein